MLTDPDVTAAYRQDWARDPAAGKPLAVVRATTTEDVAATLRWATTHHVPVVPRGAGSGLSGGATAVDGGIVLSLEKMRAVSIDPAMRIAVAQPGALNVEVKTAAAEHGLWYPPDPSSFEMCSIGGNAATNSGGLCCVKYGVTTDYVLGMQVVLADGAVLRLGGPRLKDSAGLSLTKLFVGSEGVLGVITELTLRLLPAQPPASTLVASFASIEAAADAVLAMIGKLRPSTLELMDNTSINAVEDYVSMGLDRSAKALLRPVLGLLHRGELEGDLPLAGGGRRQGVGDVEARCHEIAEPLVPLPDGGQREVDHPRGSVAEEEPAGGAQRLPGGQRVLAPEADLPADLGFRAPPATLPERATQDVLADESAALDGQPVAVQHAAVLIEDPREQQRGLVQRLQPALREGRAERLGLRVSPALSRHADQRRLFSGQRHPPCARRQRPCPVGRRGHRLHRPP